MSAIRFRLFRILIIIAIILNGSNLFAQSDLPDSLQNEIDTTDYLPYIYSDALDFNLLTAASKGYSSEIERLISKGADVNAETSEGATPLVLAVYNNKIEAVKELLDFGPVIDQVTKNSETPLLIAVKNRYFAITEELIRAGANINFRDKHGATPLHYAALYGYFDIADMLLYYNASTDIRSNEGITPLLAAIRAGNTDIADLLIQNKAGLEVKDNEGFTPFLMASFYADTVMMEILYKHGADIYATDNSHHNALSLTVMAGSKNATDFLFKLGDKWTNPGSDVIDPYEVASKYRRTDMVKILKDHNIPGDIKHSLDQIAFSVSSRFFVHDIYSGASISCKDPFLNAGFIAGCDFKLWYTRVLMKRSENLFYQYMDKGSLVYGGVFKDFELTSYADKMNYSLSASLLAGYSFGNALKGTTFAPANKFKVIPDVTFRMAKRNLSLNLGIEYIKTEFYKDGPIWLRLGVTYNYYFDNVRVTVKPIRWN